MLITLTKAQVFKYKSIEDSSAVDITSDVTVLVGKNESGKTAFLEALHKALPLGNAKFDLVFDYPRKDYVHYRPQHESKSYANVVQLTFRIEKDLADKINREVFHNAQVIQPGHTFRKTTNYNNGISIDFSFDCAAAIAALKKPLQGLEHTDVVFAEAKPLSDVLAKIEAQTLSPDSRLRAFAQEWRARTAKATNGWGLIDWHLWNAYLEPALPCFLYFDDYRLLNGKLNLESLDQRKANKQLTEADETALGLFELAGTDLKELMSEEGYENSRAKLGAIGLTITQQVFEYWKQNRELAVEFDIKADPRDQPPFNSGKNLYIRIKNLRHGVTVPFDQRSKGFIWFFSFMVWFSAIENRAGTDKGVILLLDEPGLNLHALTLREPSLIAAPMAGGQKRWRHPYQRVGCALARPSPAGFELLPGVFDEGLHFLPHLRHAVAHVKDDFDPRQVHAQVTRELQDRLQPLQVFRRIKARVTLAARRDQQAFALVEAQRLRMQVVHLGHCADHVAGLAAGLCSLAWHVKLSALLLSAGSAVITTGRRSPPGGAARRVDPHH